MALVVVPKWKLFLLILVLFINHHLTNSSGPALSPALAPTLPPTPPPSPPPPLAPAPSTPGDLPPPPPPGGDQSPPGKGLSGGQKAGIAFGVIAAAGAVAFGGMVYKKRRSNIRRARFGSAARRAAL